MESLLRAQGAWVVFSTCGGEIWPNRVGRPGDKVIEFRCRLKHHLCVPQTGRVLGVRGVRQLWTFRQTMASNVR
jgi:hypothetical protein